MRLAVLALCATLVVGCATTPPPEDDPLLIQEHTLTPPPPPKPASKPTKAATAVKPVVINRPKPQCRTQCKTHTDCHALAPKVCGENTPYVIDDEPADGPFVVCTCR